MTKISQLKLSCGAAALFMVAGTATAEAAPSCMPKVEGPIAETATSHPYVSPSNPYAGPTPPPGEMQEEFFVSCDVSGGHYKTVVHVTLPTDPAKQSGIVIAEPWHGGDFWTIYDKARNYYTRAGHVSVAIVASNMVLSNFLKKAMPERYASLSLPGPAGRGAGGAAGAPPDTTQSEVLGQVGALIKSGGLPGIKARKVLLGGMSATGTVTRQYIAYEHAQPGAKSVYDGYFPEQASVFGTGRPGAAPNPLAAPLPDLDVPVVEIQGERELVGEMRHEGPANYLRPDGKLYRLDEVAGAPHIATRIAHRDEGPAPTNRIEPGTADCIGHTWSDYPTDMLFDAALDSLVQWADKGVAPPHIPRIAMVPKAHEILRDKFGNAVGGWRSTYLDVPINTYHAEWGTYVNTPAGPSDPMAAHCMLIGWIKPLPAETIKKLYPTHAAYVAKVKADAAKLVRMRELMPADAAILDAEAEQASVP